VTDKQKSALFVAIQLLALVYLALTGPWLAPGLLVWMEILAIYLAAWAFLRFDLRQLRIAPDPARGARLIKNGPYRWIRHPMYSSVLLLTLAVVLGRPTLARVVVWLILLGDLLAKLHYEESLLMRRFPEYNQYQKQTRRLIPFVY
jgi:protein-S-isoprenylcysteine O-methyltransferase Ste14